MRELRSRREMKLYPLTSMQRSMALASQAASRSGLYLIQSILRTPERLDPETLRQAWRIIAGRHDALRTRIVIDDHRPPAQSFDGGVEIEWRSIDWQAKT